MKRSRNKVTMSLHQKKRFEKSERQKVEPDLNSKSVEDN